MTAASTWTADGSKLTRDLLGVVGEDPCAFRVSLSRTPAGETMTALLLLIVDRPLVPLDPARSWLGLRLSADGRTVTAAAARHLPSAEGDALALYDPAGVDAVATAFAGPMDLVVEVIGTDGVIASFAAPADPGLAALWAGETAVAA